MTAPLEPHLLRRCFSTLGCVDLSFGEICELAGEFGIPGIELRGMGGRLDLVEYCAEQNLTSARLHETCRQHRTQLVVAGTSVKLVSATEKDRAELQHFGEWAQALHIPYLRVFGGGTWSTALTDSDFRHAAESVNWWRQVRNARGWTVDLLLETHDAFSSSGACLALNQHLAQPLNLIWDSHHTWRVAGESPDSTWQKLGPLVRHVHIKDSVDRPSARHPYTYVLPGDGQMPLREVMALLARERFGGFVSLEWERHWHPELAPLREALLRLKEQSWFAKENRELTPIMDANGRESETETQD